MLEFRLPFMMPTLEDYVGLKKNHLSRGFWSLYLTLLVNAFR
jgi:hypothetical protein